jgi:hypothetical protein
MVVNLNQGFYLKAKVLGELGYLLRCSLVYVFAR